LKKVQLESRSKSLSGTDENTIQAGELSDDAKVQSEVTNKVRRWTFLEGKEVQQGALTPWT
jgi:hypothetical protein